MTVAELYSLLTDLPPDAEVRLAIQPRHPLEYHVAGLRHVVPSDDPDAYNVKDAPKDGVVYLLEGWWADDASRDLWNEV